MKPKLYHALFLFLTISINIKATELPDFELKDIQNKYVSLEELKGEKLTVIDFWATWCKPCFKSIPSIIEINREFRDKGVNVIGISIDSPRNSAKVKPFAISLGIDYPVLLDVNSEVMGMANVTSVPTLIIINEKNEIVYLHEGYKPGDENIIKEEITNLLNQ